MYKYSTQTLVKVPKGTFDVTPPLALRREWAVNKIRSVFKLHGGQEIDTPVFELRSTLIETQEDKEKLIYDLQDQGGEKLSLRYDLTIPFTRYIQTHGIKKMKRYQFGKVYRRDNPSYKQGRYREFLQCDFDICGNYNKHVADSEVVSIMGQCMNQLIGDQYKIKLNHKSIVNGTLEEIGVVRNNSAIVSSIDKLEKQTWVEVKQELHQKGLSEEQTSKLYDLLHSPNRKNEQVKQGLEDLKRVIQYCKNWGLKSENLEFDFKLMRGMDYYTGVLFEADIGKGVSVGGGGRYDNLIKDIPCVGMSIGLDRLLSLTAVNEPKKGLVIGILHIGESPDLISYAINLHYRLNLMGIEAHINLNTNLQIDKQIQWAVKEKLDYAVIIGEDELSQNKLSIKNLSSKEQASIANDQLEEFLQKSKNRDI